MFGESSDSSSRCPSNYLVQQILNQGQKLRNEMVKSILNNDPFCNTFGSSLDPYSNFKKMHAINMDEESAKSNMSTAEKHKLIAYLKGDEMTPKEERDVLETFRAMTTTDICELTERSYSATQNTCNCDTCKAYYKQNFLPQNGAQKLHKHIVPPLDLRTTKSEIKLTTTSTNISKPETFSEDHPLFYLKYVDTLKIAMHSFKLNHEGIIKISSSFQESKSKLPQTLTTTYFIEYDLPKSIVKNVEKKAKVDTGLQSINTVKLCSKKYHKEAIYFKQISIHDISNLHLYNLKDVEILFKVSCRNLRQKVANILGYAKFNMESFKDTRYLTCNQELLVFLGKESPIVIGTIKVSLQLGCGRLYFGKDFLDSMNKNLSTNIILPEVIPNDSDESDDSFKRCDLDKLTKLKTKCLKSSSKDEVFPKKIANNINEIIKEKPKVEKIRGVRNFKPPTKVTIDKKESSINNNISDNALESKTVLFAFIYISEVEYLDIKERTFFTFQPFCQDGTIYSPAVSGGSNPVFNFHQKVPVIYEEQFITKLRDNFMIFEFWEKYNYQDKLIGTCSIPLHQYYLAFRNPIIVKYLERNKLPVIGTDWYEPISDPKTGSINGQVQILVALGTQVQISNLENERGFKDCIVLKSKYTSNKFRSYIDNKTIKKPTPIDIPEKEVLVSSNKIVDNNKEIKSDSKKYNKQKVVTVDKSTNISLKLDKESQFEEQLLIETKPCAIEEHPKVQTAEKACQSESETKLVPQKSSTENLYVNVKTNTNLPLKHCTTTMEPENLYQTNIRKTTDLLDSLQSALNYKPKPRVDVFKAHIVIDSALHLPSRKKCKVKKVKGKNVREEILPSTYVSFESLENNVKVTQVIQKSTSPKWDFQCDVSLDSNLLTNNQKRLIFKVWRKSNNASTNPNMQIDTVLGFAALDLTVLLAGLPTVQGWFNIVDFTSQCNGQIKINVKPLENLNKYYVQKYNQNSNCTEIQTSSSISPNEITEEPTETLNRALKRKFTELDEITQRLRLRLSNVTNEESDHSNDGVADEFEKDINTICVEDDYNTVDFVREAQDFSLEQVSSSLLRWQGKTEVNKALMIFTGDDQREETDATGNSNEIKNCNGRFNDLLVIEQNNTININLAKADNQIQVEERVEDDELTMSESNSVVTTCSNIIEASEISSPASLTTLDKQLSDGKHRIDSLLQKLTLVSNQDSDTLSSRYVSGCSVNQEMEKQLSRKDTEEEIMHELGIDDNFDANRFFDSSLLDEFKSVPGSSHKTLRDAPDGAGYSSDM